MFIFKTSGVTFDSVIHHQKHAFNSKPGEWKQGEIVLVSKNKNDCTPLEKQIRYTMRLSGIREASNEEIERYWPGNVGRWKYIFDCNSTEPILEPFNLDDILGDKAAIYGPVMTFRKIDNDHELLILPRLSSSPSNSTDEVVFPQHCKEGAVTTICVNAYERDQYARRACISHYGLSCQICGFNFEQEYGEIGSGFIHVHHIVPLADIAEEYLVDPIRDLIPLCANCHAIVHRRKPAFTLDELDLILRKREQK